MFVTAAGHTRQIPAQPDANELCEERTEGRSRHILFQQRERIEQEGIRPPTSVRPSRCRGPESLQNTMRLTPSFDLFQMLPDDEGGQLPLAMAGNECRDSDILKADIPDIDTSLNM
jgi:hypothetical protein